MQRLEGGRHLSGVREPNLERRCARKLDELGVHAYERLELLRVEQRCLEGVGSREARLGLHRPDLDHPVVTTQHLGRVRLALQASATEQLHSGLHARRLLAEQGGLLEELNHVRAVRSTQ